MILISHRGNVNGPNPEQENTPVAIDSVLERNLFCEVDVWRIDGKFYLSHDPPDKKKHNIHFSFFEQRAKNLIIHCKNIYALQYFHEAISDGFHYFWHQDDEYTLTSWNWIWAYPGKTVPYFSEMISVAVMPESTLYEMNENQFKNFAAVCTDYVNQYDQVNTVRS